LRGQSLSNCVDGEARRTRAKLAISRRLERPLAIARDVNRQGTVVGEHCRAAGKPYERFSDLASKVLRVPKTEIDKRESEWQKKRIN
jgi:hypothetical protein